MTMNVRNAVPGDMVTYLRHGALRGEIDTDVGVVVSVDRDRRRGGRIVVFFPNAPGANPVIHTVCSDSIDVIQRGDEA